MLKRRSLAKFIYYAKEMSRSAEGLVMERHIRHCVKDAIDANDTRLKEQKINELLMLFQKR